MTDIESPFRPRVVVPFAFIEPNADNPGLKDFTPVIVPVDAPDREDIQHERASSRSITGGSGDDEDPKVLSVQESAPTSPNPSEVDTTPATPETPAPAEKEVPASTLKKTTKSESQG